MSEPSRVLGLADLAYKFACDIMIGTDKELMPMFVIERGDQVDVIATPYRDDDEKRTMVINVALEIVEKGCDRWSFVSESWFAHRDKGEEYRGPRPSEDPKRLEGLICIASDGKETLLYTWETKRDSKGNCTALTVPDEEPQSFSSWISTALNRAIRLHNQFSI